MLPPIDFKISDEFDLNSYGMFYILAGNKNWLLGFNIIFILAMLTDNGYCICNFCWGFLYTDQSWVVFTC